MDTKNLGIKFKFGSMAETISVQLQQQKFKFDKEKIKKIDSLSVCILKLRFADLLSDADFKKLQNKLFVKIQKHVIELNK